MKVLVAMSGGVDSSVAAALMVEAGHEVVGATLKLWGGDSDSGCCSAADVDDARRVADQVGVPHHVFNLTDVFEEAVVGPYVREHAAGRTPNPCIECNRHVKFGLLLERALRMGFDALATGHHARVDRSNGRTRLLRGADRRKDQSYVLAMLRATQLANLELPVGIMTKDEVRELAGRLGLRTAAKPDSQEVCFINSSAGRAGFLASRIPFHRGQLVDSDTHEVLGSVDALEMVTPGQRRGLGVTRSGLPRYAVEVDVPGRRVVVGGPADVVRRRVRLQPSTWVEVPLSDGQRAIAQTSAHGRASDCTWFEGALVFDEPQRIVAPGQTVAFYDPDEPDAVLGSALAA